MTAVYLFLAIMGFVGVWLVWTRWPEAWRRVPENVGAWAAMTVGVGAVIGMWVASR